MVGTGSRSETRTAIILGLLALAFLARVVGQMVVMVATPEWLPDPDKWYSGLIPYPILLPMQIGVLALQARLSWSLWHRRGPLYFRAPRLGKLLRWFAFAYFLVMVVRYIISVTVVPDPRWFNHAIPVVFHWVLAAYLFVWSRFLTEGVRR